jgi:hypothetical protein
MHSDVMIRIIKFRFLSTQLSTKRLDGEQLHQWMTEWCIVDIYTVSKTTVFTLDHAQKGHSLTRRFVFLNTVLCASI